MALDCARRQAPPMNKLVKLLRREAALGAGDQDLELHEFLQLVVVVAYKRPPDRQGGVALGEALEDD